MRDQVLAIVWAQFRITRNHFPRTSFGTVLSWCVSGLWYMLFIALALVIMRALEHAPSKYLLLGVSAGLLAIFAYMQVVPLATASSGWSLELDKLQPFPISPNTLFLIEVVLRLTSSPEMIILLCGGFLGLLLREGSLLAPLFLLTFIPFSLFIQLAVRDFILHSFARSRYGELLAVLFMAFAFVPQILVREGVIPLIKPYFLLVVNGRATPWHQIASLSVGAFSLDNFFAVLCWNAIAAAFARQQFLKSLRREDSFRALPLLKKSRVGFDLASALTRRLPDPFGAVFEKELRSLVRMPRFRVLFGMACVFSIFVFVPIALQMGEHSFMGQNALPVTSLYGLLILSDALLLNIFGFDRGAAQVYFATPPELSIVIRAKNLAAALLIGLQALAVPLLSSLFRIQITPLSLAAGLLSSAVVTVFLMSTGNLLSVYFPRPIDPRSAFRKQGGARVQLWLLVCTFGMFVLVGFAFVARWATDHDWVLIAVLALELAIGFIVYKIALESTIEHALVSKEQMLNELSKNAAPLGS